MLLILKATVMVKAPLTFSFDDCSGPQALPLFTFFLKGPTSCQLRPPPVGLPTPVNVGPKVAVCSGAEQEK